MSTTPDKTSYLAMIQRFVISWCRRRKIDIDVCQRVASGWYLTPTKRSTEHVKSFTHHAIHTRLYHATLLLCTNKLREAEDVKKDISTLHIKKRGPIRRDVIRDDKMPKNDVSLSLPGKNLFLYQIKRWREIYQELSLNW